ncbi:MAG: SDR family NAD(P)-dependent oxidoreductase [Sneathiellales bacterium]|nr:SDR family NAD(P)-dependent oxidoreductase [Sneathiellales bacterium]
MDHGKQHIWIIGASSGIGKALAEIYSSAGWIVTASARNEEKLGALSGQNGNISSLPLDVLEENCFERAFKYFRAGDLMPDLVLYCAASYKPGGLSVLNQAEAGQHMAVNYLAFTGLVDATVAEFSSRGSGHLAVISSLAGYCGLPNAALYGPTKAALINLCETLKPEFDQRGLSLSVICPGFVKTPLTDKNSFKMPYLMEPQEAAIRIKKDLDKGAFQISFPWQMTLTLKLLQKLPYFLYFRIMKRMKS